MTAKALRELESAEKEYLIINGWYSRTSGGHVEWISSMLGPEVATDRRGALALQKAHDRHFLGVVHGEAHKDR